MTDKVQTSPETETSMLTRALNFVDRNAGADREDMARAIVMFFKSELLHQRASGEAQSSPVSGLDREAMLYTAELHLNGKYTWCIVSALPRVETVVEEFGYGPDSYRAAQARLQELKSARPDHAQSPDLWRPIETAPHETKVILGWHEYGTCGDWICETGMASHGWTRNGVSTMSRHSWATHWMPLPQGPDTSTVRLPLPVKHYTGMPGAMINGEAVYDWLMDDGSVEAMTASEVEKRRKGPVSSPVRPVAAPCNEDAGGGP